MKLSEVREKYLKFFKASPRDHKEIKPAPLVLPDDPTTLFTSSGMQPLVSYLLGEKHPKGKRLVDSQPSIRLQDIEEVGDNRHTTFFEMLGNWSLGDYFKKEQLAWVWEFVTKELGLPRERLYVSISDGGYGIEKDEEARKIWKSLGFSDSHIFAYDLKDENWWSRSGSPSEMPVGDIGGPDSEIFFEFPQVEHNKKYGKECHPNCDCGRFLEIGNSVFMQYKKVKEGKFEELPNKNVDFGGGLERIVAATIDSPDIFKIDVFADLIKKIKNFSDKDYEGNEREMRVIADHIRAAIFLMKDGVVPSNKAQGYVLRRLLRRSALKAFDLNKSFGRKQFRILGETMMDSYPEHFKGIDREKIGTDISYEIGKFRVTLEKGKRIAEKIEQIDGNKAFDLYQTYGFPLELTREIFEEKGQKINREEFEKAFTEHKEKSRTASAGVFKGGLVDDSKETIRFHTATHLLQEALRRVLGSHVVQKGQNISGERSRFDFTHDKKLTEGELYKVETLINEIIGKDLPVKSIEMEKSKAEKTGAVHAFGEKYGNEVNIYYVGEDLDNAFSKEFCGGPHVSRTCEIGRVKIKKQDKIGANTVRIYLVFED